MECRRVWSVWKRNCCVFDERVFRQRVAKTMRTTGKCIACITLQNTNIECPLTPVAVVPAASRTMTRIHDPDVIEFLNLCRFMTCHRWLPCQHVERRRPKKSPYILSCCRVRLVARRQTSTNWKCISARFVLCFSDERPGMTSSGNATFRTSGPLGTTLLVCPGQYKLHIYALLVVLHVPKG